MTHTNDPRGPHHHDPADLHNEDVAHEHTDVNIRAILAFGAGIVAVTAFVAGLMAVLFGWLEGQARKTDPQRSPLSTSAPEMPKATTGSPVFGHARGGAQLLTNEPMALQKLRGEEDKRLGAYGWVEGKPGVAHMPVAEAKKLILERGLPTRAGDPIDPTVGTRAAAMGESSGGRTIPSTSKGNTGAAGTPAQQPAQQPAVPPHGPSGHQ